MKAFNSLSMTMKSKRLTKAIKKWFKEFCELWLSHIIALALGTVIGGLVHQIWTFLTGDRQGWIWALALLLPLLAAIIGTTLVMRKIKEWHKETDSILAGKVGALGQNTLFFHRALHFADEKHQLAKKFAVELLPDLLRKHAKDTRPIILILDSGTTIAPILSRIERALPDWDDSALKVWKERVTIWTNNGAGIGQLHSHSESDGHEKFEEKIFVLPGNPLSTYRAITGKETIEYLQKLKNDGSNPILISVLTANWILGGDGLDEIALCARGRGHREFKQMCIELSDERVVIAPLGKMLRLKPDDYKRLNEILKKSDDESERVAYPDPPIRFGNRHCTLLTSLRMEGCDSPLIGPSRTLRVAIGRAEPHKVEVSEFCPEFHPPPQVISNAAWMMLDIPEACMHAHKAEVFR